VFGTSRQLAVGPTSALAITVATSVVAMGDGDLSRAVTLASALALIVGVLCIAGRFVGLANVAYFISDAILVGFKTGAALYIASTQLPKLFGIEGITGNVFQRFGHVVLSLHETHVFSLVVGLAAIALFVTFGRIFPGRPTTLFVVVVAIAVMSVFGLAETGIKIVGEIPTGLPAISVPNVHLSDISALLPIALACVLLCLRRNDFSRSQFCAKAWLRHQPRARAHGSRRCQCCDGIGSRLSCRRRDVADRRQ
jgi:SulP family sulfate permease